MKQSLGSERQRIRKKVKIHTKETVRACFSAWFFWGMFVPIKGHKMGLKLFKCAASLLETDCDLEHMEKGILEALHGLGHLPPTLVKASAALLSPGQLWAETQKEFLNIVFMVPVEGSGALMYATLRL